MTEFQKALADVETLREQLRAQEKDHKIWGQKALNSFERELEEKNEEIKKLHEQLRKLRTSYDLIVQVVKNKFIPDMTYEQVDDYLVQEAINLVATKNLVKSDKNAISIETLSALNNPYCITRK